MIEMVIEMYMVVATILIRSPFYKKKKKETYDLKKKRFYKNNFFRVCYYRGNFLIMVYIIIVEFSYLENLFLPTLDSSK